MRKEEKKAPSWELQDPKPPVIRSGHMENRVRNREVQSGNPQVPCNTNLR